mmetsp:Transcript_58726/g.131146  ORF Transcript_58726/g.131146 Transcript_58726/m.131146 type:complete len:125 (-) Transcript_58726:150-524(-)
MGLRTPRLLAQVAVTALVLSVDLLAEPAGAPEQVSVRASLPHDMEVEEVLLLQITSESAADTIEAHCSPDLWTTTVWRLLRCPCATPESSVSEVCARRTTLWTVAALALVFLQSSVKDVVLLSL